MDIQRADPDCFAVYNMKINGEAPRPKTSNPLRNRIYKVAIVFKGLLVVRSFDNRKRKEVDKIVIPPTFLDSILTVLHLKLNHPKLSQLKTVIERYFFSPKLNAALRKLYETCHLCISISNFPKELEKFDPLLSPEHPGIIMNADILRRERQLILVNTDMFSSFVTSCFVDSEKTDDLAKAIIQVTTPIRRSPNIVIRVDRAPAFVSLASSPNPLLENLGIKLELADHENKNSNCVVDKSINELEIELKKLSPDGDILLLSDLAQATFTLNNKIRKRNLSASEIHFSRDAHDHSNLNIQDVKLQQKQKDLRIDNHGHLTKSRANNRTGQPGVTDVSKGDLVFMKSIPSKHETRDPHIVMGTDHSGKPIVRKALHSSHLTSRSTNMSPYVKTVANKFMFKPPQSKYNIEQYSFSEETDDSFSELSTPVSPAVLWDPLDNNTEQEMIPITFSPLDQSDIWLHEETYTVEENDTENQDSHAFDGDVLTGETANNSPTPEMSSSPRQSSSTSSSPNLQDQPIEIATYEHHEAPDLPESLLQDRRPRINDIISFYSEKSNKWVDARITHDLSKRWDRYYNIQYFNGETDGLFLLPDTRWTFLTDIFNQPVTRSNLRESSSLQSMRPSPSIPPPFPHRHTSQEDLAITHNLLLPEEENSVPESEIQGTSPIESLEWDPSFQHLEVTIPNIDEQYQSVPINPTWTPVRPLFSSTPYQRGNRVSQLRRSLPKERESGGPTLPLFMRKFNPFRKRGS